MTSKRKEKKRKRERRWVLAWQGSVVLGLSLFLGIFFVSGLIFKKTIFLKKGRLTIGFGSRPLLIASLSPQEKSLSFLLIPEETLIDSLYGYGQYRLEVFDQLEKLEEKPFLLKESLASSLAIPVEGWLGSDSFTPLPSEEKKALKKWCQAQVWAALKGHFKTNLTFGDLVRFWFYTFSVPPSEVKVAFLSEGRGLQRLVLPDESVAYRLESLKTDELVRELLSEAEVRRENLTVGVANATGQPGLAREASRAIENLGGAVVKVADWPTELSSSRILVKPEKELSFTALRLRRVFEAEAEEGDFGPFLVDVLVVVGTDFWDRLNRR
jgi:hypothetical protein